MKKSLQAIMENHYHIQHVGGGGAVEPNTMKAFLDGPILQLVRQHYGAFPSMDKFKSPGLI